MLKCEFVNARYLESFRKLDGLLNFNGSILWASASDCKLLINNAVPSGAF